MLGRLALPPKWQPPLRELQVWDLPASVVVYTTKDAAIKVANDLLPPELLPLLKTWFERGGDPIRLVPGGPRPAPARSEDVLA